MLHLRQDVERKAESPLPRILPFALFMAFIAIASPLQWGLYHLSGLTTASDLLVLWLYPLRIAAVVLLLVYFWPVYTELYDRVWVSRQELALATIVGILVYLLWVRMDWPWAMQGKAAGYNPFRIAPRPGIVLAGIRIFGAAIIVPLMEELFWRSFLIRFLIKSSYTSVPLGTFTPFSFVGTVILFGLEHHLWLAGIMAGLAYNLLLYNTRRLWPCIVAHGITNLALGAHVLLTHEWQWW